MGERVCVLGGGGLKCSMLLDESHYPALVLKVQWFLHLVSNNAYSDARWGKAQGGRMSCSAEMKYKPSLPVVFIV